MGTGAGMESNGAAPLHPALFDYACLDAVVRPALGLPPHHGPPDAFSLALAVGLLFQRFVNACSAAHVDSSEPWMHALAFADSVLSAPFQAPLPVAAAHSTELTPSTEKLEETPGSSSQPARLFSSPQKPDSSAEPVIPKSGSINDPVLSTPSKQSASSRQPPKPTVAPSNESLPARQSPPQPQNSTTPPRRAPEVQYAWPSTSRNTPVSPALDGLRPHIRAVLAAPDIDWETFNVAGVRRRLVERGIPAVTAQWAQENKARLKPVIEEEFDAFAAREQLQPSSSRTRDSVSTPLRRKFGPVSVKAETQKKEVFDMSSGPSFPFPRSANASPPKNAPRRPTDTPDRSARGRSSRSPSKPSPPSSGRATVLTSTTDLSENPIREAVPGGAGGDTRVEDSRPTSVLKPRLLPHAARNPHTPTAAHTAGSTPVPALSGQKRARSATPDSEEDEFAASFMRKRKVSASLS